MKTKIAIPMGDPAGVGPEIVVKTAVSKEKSLREKNINGNW